MYIVTFPIVFDIFYGLSLIGSILITLSIFREYLNDGVDVTVKDLILTIFLIIIPGVNFVYFMANFKWRKNLKWLIDLLDYPIIKSKNKKVI